ncbi:MULTISPECIES: hypothetical protein [unclassified Nostoc]|uniref:hypothetical protein n=1 Tax=unclassified Nostoc TaxID=2593658 RepID=UPI001D975D60|nr:hypothetical protein [Nostoc sp. JL34]MBN3885900.1 hypothetical protein [Nostoc sp. JL34]
MPDFPALKQATRKQSPLLPKGEASAKGEANWRGVLIPTPQKHIGLPSSKQYVFTLIETTA